jgi:hypothetical protein
MFSNVQEVLFKKSINVIVAIIIASCIIILITSNMTDKNGLSALIGGYSGLLLGMLFIILLNFLFKRYSYFDMFPLLMIIIIIGLLVSYLGIYFDKISSGEVSSYYVSFSLLSTLFLFTQIIMIFSAIYKSQNKNLFSYTSFSLLGLLSVINIIIVITIGIVLHFYSTQG